MAIKLLLTAIAMFLAACCSHVHGGDAPAGASDSRIPTASRRIASGDEIRVLEANAPKPIRELDTKRRSAISSLAIDPASGIVAIKSLSPAGAVDVWSIEKGAKVRGFFGRDYTILQVMHIPKTDRFVTSLQIGKVGINDMDAGEVLGKVGNDTVDTVYPVRVFDLCDDCKASNLTIAIDESGTKVAAVVDLDEERLVTVIELPSGQALWAHRYPKNPDKGTGFSAFSPDGKRLFCTAVGLLAFDSESGEMLFRRERIDFGNLDVGPSGDRIAAASAREVDGSMEFFVSIHDARDGAKLGELPTSSNVSYAVTFLDSSRYVAAAGRGPWLWIWDLDGGTAIKIPHGHGDGKAVSVLEVWDGKNTLVSSGADAVIRFWSIDELRGLIPHRK